MGTELILGRQVPGGKDVARNVVSRDFHCPHSTLASSTCPRRSPSSRLGRLAAATGWGAPGMGPPPGAGQRGPRETQGKQAQGAVASRAQADPRSCWGLGAKDWGSCWCQWAVPILRLDCPTRLSGNRLILAGVAPDN